MSEDYDMSIHTNPDAMVWAEYFCKVNPPEKTGLDKDTMVGWFVNAMMAMYDWQRNKENKGEIP